MSADFDKLREIFLAALDQAPDQRDAFLNQLCASDEELRRNVAVMLKAHPRIIRAALPHLRKSKSPRIVNIASTEALGATAILETTITNCRL